MFALPDPSALLPHAGAMLFIDRITSHDGERLTCEAEVRADNPLLVQGRLAAAGLLEYLAQAGGLLIGLNTTNAGQGSMGGQLVSARKLEFFVPAVAVGERLRVRVQRLGSEGGLERFEGSVERAGEKMAEALFCVLRASGKAG